MKVKIIIDVNTIYEALERAIKEDVDDASLHIEIDANRGKTTKVLKMFVFGFSTVEYIDDIIKDES